jgi:hypothetical protein
MDVTSLDEAIDVRYRTISDLLIEQLAMDGHSLDNIPQAVFHIQAHGSDNNTIRLTYPGMSLFPTRALSVVGYNTYGIMSYCRNDFKQRVNIVDKSGVLHSRSISIKSKGADTVAIKLPEGETISNEMSKKIGLRDNEMEKVNRGETINIPIGRDGGKISIEFALLIATTIYYSFIEELKIRLGDRMPGDEIIRQTLLELHKRMYYSCGIRDFPNCINRDMPGLYKDIYYVYEKMYSLSENWTENTVCEITTEQGTYMNVRTPTQISPYGLYIMYSTLKYLYEMPVKVPSTNATKNIMNTITRIYNSLFGPTLDDEGEQDICISNSNIMYNSGDMDRTFVGKLPELFYNIIKLRLESNLFRALIPDEQIRKDISDYWLRLADLDLHKDIHFSHLQFYLSYILLLDVSIIDGSCRGSYTKSALITPKFISQVGKKSRKVHNVMSNARTLLQNKTADIISIVTTDIINKRISEFRDSSPEKKLPSIIKWINIFDKGSLQEMLGSLISPWFNYPPISTKKSGWNIVAQTIKDTSKFKETVTTFHQRERDQEIFERQQEYIQYIEEKINDRIKRYDRSEEMQPDIKEEVKGVILNMTVLDPEDISDEEIDEIITKIINTNSQIIEESNERATTLIRDARDQYEKAEKTHDPIEIEKAYKLAEEAENVSREALDTTRKLIQLRRTRERRGSEYGISETVKNTKSLRYRRNNSNNMDKTKGGGYNHKRKSVRRKKSIRRRNITKRKRKIKRKQY